MSETDKILPPYGKLLWGKFWYSKTQRKEMDSKGYDRLFAKIDTKIIEYTEMQDVPDEAESPNYIPGYNDIEFLGRGYYYGRIRQ
jgi:hypothetical protein